MTDTVVWREFSGVTLSSDKLTATSANYQYSTIATVGRSTGKWYWEITSVTNPPMIGVTNVTTGGIIWNTVNHRGYFGDGKKWSGSAGVVYGATVAVGDVVSVLLDLDNGTLEFWKNGVSQGIAFSDLRSMGILYPFSNSGSSSTAMTARANFGASEFKYGLPVDYKSFDGSQSNTSKFLISLEDGVVSSLSSKIVTIPTMTSATTPSGIVSTNITPINSTFPYQAFDRQTSTFFHTNANITTAWLAYEFPLKVIIKKYTIESQSGYNGRAPKNWTFEGSNDGNNWTVIDTRVNQSFVNNVKNNYSFENTNSYKIYRINITANNGDAYLTFSEVEMMGEYPPILSILGVKTPSEEDYINNGMDKGININLNTEMLNRKYVQTNYVTLGSGKVFKQKIDTSKKPIIKASIT